MLSKYAMKNVGLLTWRQLNGRVATRAVSTVLRDDKYVVKPKYKEYSYAMCKADHLHLLCDTVKKIIKKRLFFYWICETYEA